MPHIHTLERTAWEKVSEHVLFDRDYPFIVVASFFCIMKVPHSHSISALFFFLFLTVHAAPVSHQGACLIAPSTGSG